MTGVKRRSFAFSLLLVVSLACGRREGAIPAAESLDDTTPQDGGTVVRRLDSDVATLNPVLATSVYDRRVDNYLFTPLVYFDQNLRVVPALAEKWDVSADGRQYTFHLNPKATFSDGTRVLASDVIFTLRKIIDPSSEAAQIASGFERVDVPNTRAVDDKTVVIAFKDAYASQLIRFNDLLVIPEHVYGKGDFRNDYASRPVGSGPYRLVRREPGREILLQRRDDYWLPKPHVERVLFKVIVDITTAWNAVKRGDIDETMITSDTWAMESRRPELQAGIDFHRFYGLNYNYIAWNGHSPLFADKRVRRALGMCVDLSSIINNLYHGTARAMSGPFTPDQWAYNPAVPVLPFDPVGARRILNDSGWFDRNGDGVLERDGKPFRFDFFVFAGSGTGLAFAQVFQEELKKVGVTMNIVTLDPALMIQRVLAGNYDAAYMAWDLEPDPDPFATLHSSQFPPRGQNFVFYSNPEADRLIEAGRRELDQGKRVKIYQQLHEVLAADQPYTWTIQVSSKWAVSKRVRNVKEGRGQGLFLWYPGEFDWWIRRDQRIHDGAAAAPAASRR
jgi:peptide/nickel transport system substrate-binding protein